MRNASGCQCLCKMTDMFMSSVVDFDGLIYTPQGVCTFCWPFSPGLFVYMKTQQLVWKSICLYTTYGYTPAVMCTDLYVKRESVTLLFLVKFRNSRICLSLCFVKNAPGLQTETAALLLVCPA